VLGASTNTSVTSEEFPVDFETLALGGRIMDPVDAEAAAAAGAAV
jgi:hypothetical protein